MMFFLQIKKINLEQINIGDDFAHSIGFCTKDDQSLYLYQCEITKPDFEALCIAFGDKNVMILYNVFSKSFGFLIFFYLFNKMKLSQSI